MPTITRPLWSFLLCIGLGCAEASSPAPLMLTSVAQTSNGLYSAEIFTSGRLETGMTTIYLALTSLDGRINDAAVTFTPLMTMTDGTSHGAPVIAPPAPDGHGNYRCDVVFPMASSGVGSWSAGVGVARPGLTSAELVFPKLAVAESGRARTFEYTDPTTSTATSYVLSLSFPKPPTIGLNPVVLTLHQKRDATTFEAVTDAAIVLTPQMPSMGHGSPGSVNPTATSLGRYEGQVSFSMAGTWETSVAVARDGITIGTVTFTTEL